MPHITTAMHRSVRRGVGDIMVDSLLGKRDLIGQVSSVKNTFSSWDNCMAQTYCKWPVIVAIVIAALIVLSIVTCIVRCACLGYSCCCACFSCLKCCDCCGDSCAGKKNKPMKHLDDPNGPYQNASRQGYKAPEPMMGGGLGALPAKHEPPQYAQFEVGRSGLAVEPKAGLSEDALPPMPSWDAAAKKHVLTEEEKQGVELGELDPTTGQKIPLMSGAGTSSLNLPPPSPIRDQEGRQSPFGARPAPGPNPQAYMNVPTDPYAQNQNGRGYNGTPSPDGYRGNGRGYAGGSGQARGYPQDRNGQGRAYGQPSPHDPYSQDQFPQDQGFVGVAVGGYGRPEPSRQYSNDSRQYSSDSSRPLNPGREYSSRPGYPADNYQQNGPSRGPSRGPGGPGRLASPPLQNNSGFDFGADQYSRPSPPSQQNSYGFPNPGRRQNAPPSDDGYYAGSSAPPSYATRNPPIQDPSYPRYQPYQSNQGGKSPSSRGGREPQRWDPVQQ